MMKEVSDKNRTTLLDGSQDIEGGYFLKETAVGGAVSRECFAATFSKLSDSRAHTQPEGSNLLRAWADDRSLGLSRPYDPVPLAHLLARS